MFVGIFGVSAALVYLSLLAGIGLAADAQVSFAGENCSGHRSCRPWWGRGSAEPRFGSFVAEVYTWQPDRRGPERGWCGWIVAGNLFMRETGPELTILQCHIGYPLYQLLGLEIKYDVRRWHFLGGAKRDYMPIMQRAELPYASISEWSQAKNPIVWSADTLGSTVENPARIMRMIGIRMKLVSGYPGGTARLLAVLRGEADATPELLSTAKQHLDAGKLKVVGRLIPAPNSRLSRRSLCVEGV